MLNKSESDFLRGINAAERSQDLKSLHSSSLSGTQNLSFWYSIGMIATSMVLLVALVLCVGIGVLFAILNSRKYDTPLGNIVEQGHSRGWGSGDDSGEESDSGTYEKLTLVDSFSNVDIPSAVNAVVTSSSAPDNSIFTEEDTRPEIEQTDDELDISPASKSPSQTLGGQDRGIAVAVGSTNSLVSPMDAGSSEAETDGEGIIMSQLPNSIPKGNKSSQSTSRHSKRKRSSSLSSIEDYYDEDGRLVSSAEGLKVITRYRPEYKRKALRGIDISSEDLYSPAQ